MRPFFAKPPERLEGIYDNLRPEDYPDKSPEEAKEHIRRLQRATRMVGDPGQFRLDTERNRVVETIESVWDDIRNEHGVVTCRSSTNYWYCRDIMTDEVLKVNWLKWSFPLTEMEVLAWVLSQVE